MECAKAARAKKKTPDAKKGRDLGRLRKLCFHLAISCYFSGQKGQKMICCFFFFSGGQKEGISLPVGVQAERTGVRAEKQGESQENTRSDCETVVCPQKSNGYSWLFMANHHFSHTNYHLMWVNCPFYQLFFLKETICQAKADKVPQPEPFGDPTTVMLRHIPNRSDRPQQSPGVSEIFAPSIKRKPRSQVILR